MTTVDVPGAELHYRKQGRAPLLVAVPGASGVGDSFRTLAAQLEDRFTVLAYDRMLCFSGRQPGNQGPRRVTEAELRATFATGWHLDTTDPVTLDSPGGPGAVHGWRVTATRL